MVSTVGPVSNAESVAVQDAGPAARLLFSLDDGHVVAAAGEVARRRQAGQAGPNHHNGVHRCGPTMITVLEVAQVGELVKVAPSDETLIARPRKLGKLGYLCRWFAGLPACSATAANSCPAIVQEFGRESPGRWR